MIFAIFMININKKMLKIRNFTNFKDTDYIIFFIISLLPFIFRKHA